ncbi:MAG: orotate phosphoribosyltransferase [Deltaproteobacteria bacterium]|nr:orotate phosphoribosyltransferase [Deltaproteobacteria bacterium]
MVKTKLLDLLIARSYRHADSPSFRLASGKLSNFYVDCKATTMCGEAMPLVGQVVASLLPPEADAVGGLTMGADWIAAPTAFHCQLQGRRVDVFSVRKEPKAHGLKKWIEGCAERGSKVVVLDDVVTTGGSTIDAIRRCREEGLRVVGVVALIDRQEENGMENIRLEAGPDVPLAAVFTHADLEARWRARAAGAHAATG